MKLTSVLLTASIFVCLFINSIPASANSPEDQIQLTAVGPCSEPIFDGTFYVAAFDTTWLRLTDRSRVFINKHVREEASKIWNRPGAYTRAVQRCAADQLRLSRSLGLQMSELAASDPQFDL